MVPETTHDPPGGETDDHGEAEPDATLGSGAIDVETCSTVARSVTHTGAARDRLHSIERAILQARIAALEQALEAKDRQRTAIVDRYETILAERDRDGDDGAVAIEFEDDGGDEGLLGGLRSLLGRR
ncbi:hypothetical protein [Halorientalis salina]|uniref:hypothetical protein n=1 Tax=Halorientalis salina TaxID=2932266 RepID=UPI0010AB8C56|nr:hypothetical protein [Halorientalis salina]